MQSLDHKNYFSPPLDGSRTSVRSSQEYAVDHLTTVVYTSVMKTVISVKVDVDVRNRARRVAKKIGVPLSMIVNQHLKQFADERRIEFYEPLIPNAKTRKILDKALKEIHAGDMRNFSPVLHNADDAIAWLHKK